MAKVIVLGAGIGGVPMAYELRERLGREAEITVVAESEYFQFVPSNPWVAVSWRKPEDVKVHLPPVFARLGIGLHSVGAKRVIPERNEVLLNDGADALLRLSRHRHRAEARLRRDRGLRPSGQHTLDLSH